MIAYCTQTLCYYSRLFLYCFVTSFVHFNICKTFFPWIVFPENKSSLCNIFHFYTNGWSECKVPTPIKKQNCLKRQDHLGQCFIHIIQFLNFNTIARTEVPNIGLTNINTFKVHSQHIFIMANFFVT